MSEISECGVSVIEAPPPPKKKKKQKQKHGYLPPLPLTDYPEYLYICEYLK